MEWIYYINLVFMVFSGWVAYYAFKEGNDSGGWVNVVASALNGAVFANHFF